MPVKVVSDQPVKTKRVVCTKCAYELEYSGEDVQESSGYSMGELDISYFITCPRPTCKQRVYVKSWNSK